MSLPSSLCAGFAASGGRGSDCHRRPGSHAERRPESTGELGTVTCFPQAPCTCLDEASGVGEACGVCSHVHTVRCTCFE